MTTTPTFPACPFDHHAPLSSEEIFADYAGLRARGVTYSAEHGGFWVLSRYADVRAALRDPATFSSAGGIRIPAIGTGRSIPIEFDPPLHTDYRKLFTARITSRSVRAMTPFLTDLINGLVDGYHENGGGDFVRQVALPMPLAVLEEVVGFQPDTISQLRELTEDSWHQITERSLDEARSQLCAVIRAEIARHRSHLPDDYLTELLAARVDGRPVTDDELERVLLTFAIAGHETTTNAAGWLAHLLARNQSLQTTVRHDPDRVPVLVEEALRVGSPAQLFARETTRDVEIGGQTIPAGSRVLLALASANRDETQFPDATTIDLDRGLRGHLAFGFGIHQCPGAVLARTELKLLLTRLAELPALVPAGTPDFGALVGGIHHGPRSLPLVFDEGAFQ
ncbi:cytochrome P450 [Sciscionella marina]|uniref:cytochrome P450 n=1 Tax=Sciscionella marina TaxID=508770 RepID=UPI000378B9DE|nr:cytochrome P450 [Sciscionella marina]